MTQGNALFIYWTAKLALLRILSSLCLCKIPKIIKAKFITTCVGLVSLISSGLFAVYQHIICTTCYSISIWRRLEINCEKPRDFDWLLFPRSEWQRPLCAHFLSVASITLPHSHPVYPIKVAICNHDETHDQEWLAEKSLLWLLTQEGESLW